MASIANGSSSVRLVIQSPINVSRWQRYCQVLGLSFSSIDELTEPVITVSLSPEVVDRLVNQVASAAQTDERQVSVTEAHIS